MKFFKNNEWLGELGDLLDESTRNSEILKKRDQTRRVGPWLNESIYFTEKYYIFLPFCKLGF